jgi:hypothetical protein
MIYEISEDEYVCITAEKMWHDVYKGKKHQWCLHDGRFYVYLWGESQKTEDTLHLCITDTHMFHDLLGIHDANQNPQLIRNLLKRKRILEAL